MTDVQRGARKMFAGSWPAWSTGAALVLCTVALPGALLGQERAVPGFDIGRAYVVDSSPFAPFFATDSRPLREVLRERLIEERTPVLVLDHPAGRLALSTEQMTYHHAAQGDFAGEPWMVSF